MLPHLYKVARKAISTLHQDESEMSLVISVRLSRHDRNREREKVVQYGSCMDKHYWAETENTNMTKWPQRGPGKVKEETQHSCFKGKSAVTQVRNAVTQSSIINCLSEARTLCSVYFLAFKQ